MDDRTRSALSILIFHNMSLARFPDVTFSGHPHIQLFAGHIWVPKVPSAGQKILLPGLQAHAILYVLDVDVSCNVLLDHFKNMFKRTIT